MSVSGSSPSFPTISVITVCRNALPALRATAESVLGQGYPALEYWVIDGASTDGTARFLEELADRGVRVRSEPDRGISDAMNKGLRLATGELVAHLHAGDRYAPGALAAVARHWARDPAADVFCAHLLKREERGEVVYRCEPGKLTRDMTVNHPGTWTRRAVFDRLGGFEESLRCAMDYDFFLRAARAGCRFHVIPEALALMEGGGQSERSRWDTLRETHAIRRRHLDAGWERSGAYLLYLWARGGLRRTLQGLGLGAAVAWYRRRFALVRKG
ncbi:MAG TPA: glycosyltransferase family 2 protein [Candidatus Eisenbacteria bacterium]|jgi:glycosyltransferase